MKQILGGLARANMRRAVTTVNNSSQLHSHRFHCVSQKENFSKSHSLQCTTVCTASKKENYFKNNDLHSFQF